MSELKCCPFCGGEAKIVRYCGKKTIAYVECTNCLAYMGNQRIMTSSSRGKEYFESEENLISDWNRRKPMANIVEKLEGLKNGASGCNGVMCENCEYNDICFDGEQSFKVALDRAINIVKQEINNGLE